MPSRDVEINLVAHDRTGAATRSAARNLEQLARKTEKLKAQKIKTKVDVVGNVDDNKIKKTFGAAGDKAGNAFITRFRKKLFRLIDAHPLAQQIEHFGRTGNLAGRVFSRGFRTQLTKLVNANPFATTVEHFGRTGARAGARFASRFRDGLKAFGGDANAFANRFSAKAKTILGRGGQRSGAAFMAGFLKTVTFGQIGQGFARGAIKAAPAAAKAGGILGVAMAGVMVMEITQALAAGVPLALGALLLAPPIVFLLKKQGEAAKQVAIQEKKVASIKKQIAAAEARDARASARSGDSAKAKQARQDKINDLKKELAAERNILREQEKQAQGLIRLKAKAKDFLEFVSRPVKVPLQQSLRAIGDGLTRLKKPFRELTDALGPALVPFTKGVMKGVLTFVERLKPALPGMVASLKQWGAVMPQITGAVADLLAKLSSHPEAVQAFADSFDTFVATSGDVILGLEGIASKYGKVEALIRGGRTGQWGDEWTKVGGKAGAAAKKVGEAQLFILRKYDDMLQGIRSIPGSPFDKLKNDTHQARLQMEAEFGAVTTAKKKMDTSLSSGPNKIQLKADDTDLTAKIINAKKRLKEIKGTKARARIEADISDFRLKRATVRAQLHLLDKSSSTSKLKADAKNVKAQIADVNRRLKDKNLTTPQKTRLRADKRQASATLRQLQGEINQLHGKQVDIWIKTHRITYYGHRGNPPTNPKAGSGAPGSSFTSWSAAQNAMLNGGGTSRTGGPTPVNVEAPIVNTTVMLDRRVIRAESRSTVLDENRRAAYRARVGARR